MKNSKYTPGPWHVIETAPLIKCGENNLLLAPEMLEALEQAQCIIETLASDLKEDENSYPAFKLILNAIAKARGGA